MRTPWSAQQALCSVFLSHRNRLVNFWPGTVEWLRVNPMALEEMWRVVDGPLGCFGRVKCDLDPTIPSIVLASQNLFGLGESPWTNVASRTELVGEFSSLRRRFALVILTYHTGRHGFVERYGRPLGTWRIPIQNNLGRLFVHGEGGMVTCGAAVILSSAGGNRLKSGFFCRFLKIMLHCEFKRVNCRVLLLRRCGGSDTR